MIELTLPTKNNEKDVLDFYKEFDENNEICIGFNNHTNCNKWLKDMTNRHLGVNLPNGYVQEIFIRLLKIQVARR